MREYTEEFYKVNLREGYVEYTPEKTTRYIKGLRLDIQDEINMLSPRTIEEAYHCSLKEEELRKRMVFLKGKGNQLDKDSF